MKNGKMRFSMLQASLLGLATLFITSCAAVDGGHIAKDANVEAPRVIDNPISLRDFLVKAGVTLDYQSGVPIIKGGPPLYVIDGIRMGHDYYEVARTINVNDVASVEVIKNTGQALMYGRDASNGVIVIKTKTGV